MKKLKDNVWVSIIITTIVTFAMEMIFKALNNFNIISYATLRIFISCLFISLLVNYLVGFTKKRWLRNSVIILYVLFYGIYTCLQIGFINYLGVYISLNTSSQLGAVASLIRDFFQSFKLSYLTIFIPFIFLILYLILAHKLEYNKLNFNLVENIKLCTLIIISVLIYISTFNLSFMQDKLQSKTNKELFLNPNVPTIAVNQFGTIMFGVVDFKSFLFPVVEDVSNLTFADSSKEDKVTERKTIKVIDELSQKNEGKKYDALNKYFASLSVPGYNDYTGMFEGKNVIVILMESVNEAMTNEEYFPNFTKLYNEGWHFNNNYSPRNSCATGNNEFSAMTGLYSIYNTCTSNTYLNNTYFEAIFNLFNNKGYNTTSMHDYYEWYYKRHIIHPNMGSNKYYGASNLKINASNTYGEWASDEEFMKKAMDIILNDDSDKPFMTWLTTVSGHLPYNVSSKYGDLYKSYFQKEGYNSTVSRYLSKIKVTDDAIGVMIDRLEEKGILDDTVIVMLADHYPYSLGEKNVSTFIKHSLKDYEIERTPFVIYNSTMEPQEFTMYTSYINMLPTLANLMNLDYDPRLYMGSDILSPDYKSLVTFADGSWKNEKAYYNASTSKIKYYGEDKYTDEEIKNITDEVATKIEISTIAIKNNYFNYLNEKIEEQKYLEDLENYLYTGVC